MIQLPYVPTQVLANADMSADITSDKIQLGPDNSIGLQFIWTGTPTGVLGVSVSNDGGATFTALTLSGLSPGVVNPAGGAGTGWLDLNNVNCDLVEVTYAKTSGAGFLSVFAMAKK